VDPHFGTRGLLERSRLRRDRREPGGRRLVEPSVKRLTMDSIFSPSVGNPPGLALSGPDPQGRDRHSPRACKQADKAPREFSAGALVDRDEQSLKIGCEPSRLERLALEPCLLLCAERQTSQRPSRCM
jgi:hypothetical protein